MADTTTVTALRTTLLSIVYFANITFITIRTQTFSLHGGTCTDTRALATIFIGWARGNLGTERTTFARGADAFPLETDTSFTAVLFAS
jgi:hypothetical protein